MKRILCIIFFCTLFIIGQAYAEIYKCQRSNGTIDYTSKACPNGLVKKKTQWLSAEEDMRLKHKLEQERLAKLEKKRLQKEKEIEEKTDVVFQQRLEEITLVAEKKAEIEAAYRRLQRISMAQEKKDRANLEFYDAISGSDSYSLHKEAFNKAAGELIHSGVCSLSEFKEMGGWVRSYNFRKRAAVFFLYCDGRNMYLNAITGKHGR